MSVVFITGASRGFGKSIALELASTWPGAKCDFILTSSKLTESQATAEEVIKIGGPRDIKCLAIDFADMANLEANIHTLFALAPKSHYERVVLINNHGSLGPLSPVAGLADSIDSIRREMDLNITSVFALVSIAMKTFTESRANQLDLVSISSLAAVMPIPAWSLYCAGKAARDMLHAVVAKEQGDNQNRVKTLNYAPGPLDTDMQAVIRNTDPVESQRALYTKMKEEGTLLKPADSARKLVFLLEKREWNNGAHIDFYDI